MKIVKSLWIVALVVVMFACNEDDPLPRATVDFTNDIAEVGRPVMFDNMTLNADHYEWKFSDGQTSDKISPTITFNKPGNVDVVLKAFTKDGQVDSVAKSITVKQRFLTAYIVKAFPMDSLGFAWDKNEALDEDKLPDVLVELVVDKDPNDLTEEELANSLLGPIFFNATGQDISSSISQDLILTDEDWAFVLRDWDGADENTPTLNDPYSLVVGATFNPVQIPTTKNADGTGGSFSITGYNSNDKFIDITFFFELR